MHGSNIWNPICLQYFDLFREPSYENFSPQRNVSAHVVTNTSVKPTESPKSDGMNTPSTDGSDPSRHLNTNQENFATSFCAYKKFVAFLVCFTF